MPLLQVGKSEIYYEIHGEGETLVLAHGMGGNHAIWYQQIPVLAESYRVVVFDHRGFGNSTDKEGLGRNAYVNDLAALFEHLEIERAVFVGQSMGAGTCVGFTGRFPERVAGLVIADSLHGFVESENIQSVMDRAREQTRDLSQIERVLGKSSRKNNPVSASLYCQLNSFNQVDRHSLKGNYETLFTPRALSDTGVPIMFIAGLEDVLFPIEAIRLLQAEVEGSFLVEISDAGHSAFYESPSEFNDSLLSFLQMTGLNTVRRPKHSNTAGYAAPVRV